MGGGWVTALWEQSQLPFSPLWVHWLIQDTPQAQAQAQALLVTLCTVPSLEPAAVTPPQPSSHPLPRLCLRHNLSYALKALGPHTRFCHYDKISDITQERNNLLWPMVCGLQSSWQLPCLWPQNKAKPGRVCMVKQSSHFMKTRSRKGGGQGTPAMSSATHVLCQEAQSPNNTFKSVLH